MQARSSFPLIAVLALVAVLLGFGIVFWINAPRATSFSPSPAAARVSSLAPVEIIFSQPMDLEITATDVSIEPPHPGRVEWPDEQTLRFVPFVKWPVDMPISVTLTAGARSSRGLPLLRAPSWQFQVGAPRVAYLQLEPDSGNSNIWSLLLDGSDARKITDQPLGVNEFDVATDGTRIAFSAIREDGGSDLMEIDVGSLETHTLFACADESCRSPVFSPDGSWLAFERRINDDALAGTTVMLLNLDTNEQTALPVSGNEVTHTPTWVPTGMISFVNETLRAVGWYDSESGLLDYAPDFAVEMGAWSPDGSWLVLSEILLQEHTHAETDATETPAESGTPATETTPSPTVDSAVSEQDVFFTHLLRLNIANRELVELTDIQLVEDAAPVFSPSGRQLAFGRKFVDEANWTPGRQLWLMQSDGSAARQLTNDGLYNHAAFVWSPDEQTLVYMRFNVADFNAPPEIWAIGADGENARRLAIGGALPHWLP